VVTCVSIIENVQNYFDKKGNKALGLAGKTEISVLGKGESNLNLLAQNCDKEFVVRVSLLEKSRTKREYNTLKSIELLKIAPRAYILDTSREFVDEDFSVIERLLGTQIIGYISAEDAMTVARILSKLHRKKYSHFGQIDGKLQAGDLYDVLTERKGWVSYEFDKLAEEITRNHKPDDSAQSILPALIKLKAALDDICLKNKQFFSGSRFSVIHGDLRQWNLLKYPDGINLIDWELARIADPAEDIANFFVNSYILESSKKAFMDEYRRSSEDKNLEKRIKVYALLQSMGIAFWFGKNYYYNRSKKLHRELNTPEREKEYLKDFFYFLSLSIKQSGLDPHMTPSKARQLGGL